MGSFCKIILAVLLLNGCAIRQASLPGTKLANIHIIDRNGLSETISNKDRLEAYNKVNFVAPQPYQKVMRVYTRQTNGDVRATITTYHENGQIKQYLEIVNSRALGKYREWYENGQQKVEATVIGGVGDIGPSHEKTWLFEGICKAWDDQGHLEAEVNYDKGVLCDNTFHYHPNGVVWKRIPFEGGLIHGKEEIYLENGALLQSNEYQKGQKNGSSIRYWPNGQIAARETYCVGKLVEGEYLDLNSTRVAVICQGEGTRALFGKTNIAELHEYHEGELDGEVQAFSEDGTLHNKYHVKKGLKHGEEIEYYEKSLHQKTPLPKLAVNWYQGSVQGTVKTWYPNGNQESQREISKNQKNGLLTAWYEEGSLMMIEEYEQDRLINGSYFKKGQKLPISKVREGTGMATLFDSEGNFVSKIQYLKGFPSS